jgi:hypothetical protein
MFASDEQAFGESICHRKQCPTRVVEKESNTCLSCQVVVLVVYLFALSLVSMGRSTHELRASSWHAVLAAVQRLERGQVVAGADDVQVGSVDP